MPYAPGARPAVGKPSAVKQQTPFADVLRQVEQNATGGLKVSAHATARMQQRGVTMTASDWTQISKAVDKAEQKGSKDAYLLYGNTGLVVNVPNRTVITAMAHQDDTIVTNIDSVVMVQRLDR